MIFFTNYFNEFIFHILKALKFGVLKSERRRKSNAEPTGTAANFNKRESIHRLWGWAIQKE
jgi:hypothetical protein